MMTHIFPVGDINWISALGIGGDSPRPGIVMACVGNILFSVDIDSKDLAAKHALGPEEETTALAVSVDGSMMAVGGVMDTKVYDILSSPTLLYQVRNSTLLVQELRFSRNRALLGVVDGGLGGSGVTVVDASAGGNLHRFGEIWPPTGNARNFALSIGPRSISFSDDGQLVAVGQGGRVGIYKTPSATRE